MESTQYPEQHHIELVKERVADLLVDLEALKRTYNNIEYEAKLIASYLNGPNPNQLRWDF